MRRIRFPRTLAVILSILLMFPTLSAMATGPSSDPEAIVQQVEEAASEEETVPNDEAAADEERPPAADGGQAYVPGQVIVQFKKSVISAQQVNVASTYRLASIQKAAASGAELMQINSGDSVEEVVRGLQASGLVEFAQPNYIYTKAEMPWDAPRLEPNDPLFGHLWGLHSGINAAEAWALLQELPELAEVIVAVLDTPFWLEHPDLAGKFVDGYNVFNPDDEDGIQAESVDHGTHVAGTIAASPNNGVGVVGVAPNVKIMPVVVLNEDGVGNSFTVALGIHYAAQKGVRVMNASLSGPLDVSDMLVRKAIESANAVFVSAAGNYLGDIDVIPVSPGSLNLPNQITVAGVDQGGALAEFSNYGSRAVHVGAPGDHILSTVGPDSYDWWSGTSMAAPHVSGIAGVIMAQKNLTPTQAVALIKESGNPVESLGGVTTTGKMVNLYNAVATTVSTPTVTLSGASAGQAGRYDIRFQVSDYGRLVRTASKTDQIVITFPDGTELPGEIDGALVTVNGRAVAQILSPQGQTLPLPVPAAVAHSAGVTVTIDAEAGIRNPQHAGAYRLSVRTSGDAGWAESAPYTVSAAPLKLTLDQTTYHGLGAYDVAWDEGSEKLLRKALITLTGFAAQDESVPVRVSSATDPEGISVVLTETRAGLFMGTFGFTDQPSDEEAGLLEVANGARITVTLEGVDPAVAVWREADITGRYILYGEAEGKLYVLSEHEVRRSWQSQGEGAEPFQFLLRPGAYWLAASGDGEMGLTGPLQLSQDADLELVTIFDYDDWIWVEGYGLRLEAPALEAPESGPTLGEWELSQSSPPPGLYRIEGSSDPFNWVHLTVDDEDYELFSGLSGDFAAYLWLTDGEHTLTIQATDLAGLQSEIITSTFTLTSDPPELEVWDVYEGDPYLLIWTEPFAQVVVIWNRVGAEDEEIASGEANGSGRFLVDLMPVDLQEGDQLTVTATSWRGSTETTTISVLAADDAGDLLVHILGAKAYVWYNFPDREITIMMDREAETAQVLLRPWAKHDVADPAGPLEVSPSTLKLDVPEVHRVTVTTPSGREVTYTISIYGGGIPDFTDPQFQITIENPADGSLLTERPVQLSGTAPASLPVLVYLDGVLVTGHFMFHDLVADINGNWSFEIPAFLASGQYTVEVATLEVPDDPDEDEDGFLRYASASATFTLQVEGDPEVDPVYSDSRAITGVAYPEATVWLSKAFDGEALLTATADAAGAFTFDISELGLQAGDVRYVFAETGEQFGGTQFRVLSAGSAMLSALTLSQGTLAFQPGTTAYSVTYANTVDTIRVSAVAQSTAARVKINGQETTALDVALNVGNNTITIKVTAENGTERTYTITATRRSAGGGGTPGPSPQPQPQPQPEPQPTPPKTDEATPQPEPSAGPIKSVLVTVPNGTATLVVTVDENIDLGKVEGALVLDLTGTSGDALVGARTASIPTVLVGALAGQGKDLVIQTGSVTIHVPPQALLGTDAVQGAGTNANVQLTVAEVSLDGVSEDDEFAALIQATIANGQSQGLQPTGNILVLTAELVDENGESTPITQFGQSLTVVIPFGNAANPNHVAVYRLNRETGEWEFRGGTVDPATGTVTVELSSFSEYAAMAYNKSFADVPASHWAKVDIEWLAARHIVKGISQTEFAPEQSLTRAEFATLLARTLGLKLPASQVSSFQDVARTDWFFEGVQAAADAGLIRGFAGEFRPNDPVTRQEMAVILSRVLALRGKAATLPLLQAKLRLTRYADGAAVAEWATAEMAAVMSLALVNERSSALEPGANATRAEATVALRRLLSYLGEL